MSGAYYKIGLTIKSVGIIASLTIHTRKNFNLLEEFVYANPIKWSNTLELFECA